jgi:hypothetical protein
MDGGYFVVVDINRDYGNRRNRYSSSKQESNARLITCGFFAKNERHTKIQGVPKKFPHEDDNCTRRMDEMMLKKEYC